MNHVLVIEDQKPVRDAIGDILETIGCQVRLVGDGQAALEALLKTPFQLITLDLNMPSLDGVSLLETLAAQDNPNLQTPIIIISAYLSPNTTETLQQFGVTHFLSKPFEAGDLLKIVQPILEPNK